MDASLLSRSALAGRAGFVLLVALVFTGLAGGAEPAEPTKWTKVRSLEGFTEFKLDNGLKVLFYPDPSASKVTVNITIFVGSRHEGYGETGMAHLLEHMLFKGSPKFLAPPKALSEHGASFNGTTWLDRTNYFETMPAGDANLKFGIELEADRLVNSFVKREDLVSEMTVVRNEFEMGENNPVSILSQRMTAAAFEWHNYGKSTIGNRSDIERVPITKLQAFYKKYYRPDNALLIVAGKFDEKKALEYIGTYFGRIKKPAGKVDKTYTEEPAQDGEREVVLRRVGKVGCVGALYHIPAGTHPDFAAADVLGEVLTSEPTGRLYTALVKTKKATRVFGGSQGLHDPGTLEVLVRTDEKDEAKLRKLRDDMLAVVEGVGKEKLTDDEVKRARTKLLKQRELLLNTPQSVAIELSEWAAKGDWRLFLLHRDRLEKVTTNDVNRVGARYLRRSNRTSGIFVPTEAPSRAVVARAPDVEELLKDYKGRKAVAAGEEFVPTPDNIEKRVTRSKWGPEVNVALLPKKTRAEAVVVMMQVHFGNPKSLKDNEVASDLLGVLMQRGVKGMTFQKISDELDALKARLMVRSSGGTLTVAVQCKKDTLPKVTELLRKVLREPTFPEDQFDLLKRRKLEGLKQSQSEPNALAIRALQRTLNPYPKDDVRYMPTIKEEIDRTEATTLAQVKKLYAEQLGGGNVELAAVGDFDADQLTKDFKGILKGWKTETKYERIQRDPNLKVKGDKQSINVPDKANALYLSGHAVDLKDDDTGYEAVLLGSYLVGEAPLASRISNRVRGKEGLSYGAGARVRGGSLDRAGTAMIFAICAPANLNKVDAAVADELAKLLKGGVTDEEVKNGIKGYLLREQTGRGNDSAIAQDLLTQLRQGRTYKFEAEREKKIAALTAKEVSAALRKVFDPKRLVTVEAGDLKKKEALPKKP
jgi:zinc protease